MAGDKSDSIRDSNHGVFLGNKHLRSKSGLEEVTEWRLKHPATRYKKTTSQNHLWCFLYARTPVRQGRYTHQREIHVDPGTVSGVGTRVGESHDIRTLGLLRIDHHKVAVREIPVEQCR